MDSGENRIRYYNKFFDLNKCLFPDLVSGIFFSLQGSPQPYRVEAESIRVPEVTIYELILVERLQLGKNSGCPADADNGFRPYTAGMNQR